MASLVDQIFEQARLGTAVDPNANPFAQGVSLGQNQQRIDLSKQQLAMEIAQLPLKQTLLQQTTQLNGLKLTEALQERQNYVDSSAAFTDLNTKVAPLLASGKLDEAQNLALSSALSNNFLLTDPRYKVMTSQLDAMRKEADLAEIRLGQLDAVRLRAEAAMSRADTAALAGELGSEKLKLAQEKEARLREQFDYQVKKFETTVPADKLAIFRERAKSIQNDLTLLADAPKRDAQLKALAEELRLGTIAPTAAAPTNTPSSPFKVRVIKP